MPSYELYYFPVSGRAGVSRILFALAEKEFTDTQYNFEQWGANKNDRTKVPLGQLPVLRVDDTYLAEALAINDFLAAELGLHGNNNMDRARVSMITHAVFSLWTLWTKFAYEKDQELECKLREKFLKEQVPTSFTCWETILKERSNGDKYFLGDKVTWADAAFLDAALTILSVDKTALDKFPKLSALHKRLVALPQMVKHIPTRKLKF